MTGLKETSSKELGIGVSMFENADFGNIRVAINGDTVLFCGKDVATVLGYTETAKAIREHCKGVSEIDTPTAGGIQKLKYITEGDLYRLVCSSRLPKAQEFEKWVFDEILPTIHKTGKYCVPQKPHLTAEELETERQRLEIRKIEASNTTEQLKLDKARFYQGLANKYNGRYGEVLDAYATRELSGKFLISLPKSARETYTAGEIGAMLGITANMVGRIANDNGLKCDKYGEYFIDKAKGCDKEVRCFRYYKEAADEIAKYIEEGV